MFLVCMFNDDRGSNSTRFDRREAALHAEGGVRRKSSSDGMTVLMDPWGVRMFRLLRVCWEEARAAPGR
jgi:hypothetical protein